MLRALVAVLIVLTATGMAVAAGPVSADTHTSAGPRERAVLTADEFDNTTFRINVSENGSARWTFIYRRGLSNESEREQFSAFAETFNSQQTGMYANFKERSRRLAVAGTNETGRQMNATNFTRRAYINDLNNQGVVEMSFRWSNFSDVRGDTLVVGDVFTGGLYIGENQRFEVTWDDSLTFDSANPEPDNRSADTVTWVGGTNGRQFTDSKPNVTFQRQEGTTGGAGHGTDATESNPGGFSQRTWAFGLTALVVTLVIGGGVAYRTRTIGTSVNESSEQTGTATVSITEEELLSDEDRVLSLLRDNGGRMKQVNIVDETGWSKSKVSMLLSEMDEDGQISKLRVGRENIISIAGDEPEAARSPFDDK